MKYAIMVLALVGVLARPTAAIADRSGNRFYKMCELDRSICGNYFSYYAWAGVTLT